MSAPLAAALLEAADDISYTHLRLKSLESLSDGSSIWVVGLAESPDFVLQESDL